MHGRLPLHTVLASVSPSGPSKYISSVRPRHGAPAIQSGLSKPIYDPPQFQ